MKKPWTDIRHDDSDKKHLFDSKTPKKALISSNLRSSSKNIDSSNMDIDDFDDPKDAFKTPKKWSRLKPKTSGIESEKDASMQSKTKSCNAKKTTDQDMELSYDSDASDYSGSSNSKDSYGSKERGVDKAVRKIKKHKKNSSRIAEKLFVTEKKIRCGSQMRYIQDPLLVRPKHFDQDDSMQNNLANKMDHMKISSTPPPKPMQLTPSKSDQKSVL